MAMKKTWSPRSYKPRDPRSTQQQNGRVVNPPRALKFGGVGEASLINTDPKKAGTVGPRGSGPVSDRGRG